MPKQFSACVLPLPGLSNRNVRIDTPSGVYAVRLSRADGSGYVDRSHELAVTAALSSLGIGAPFVAGDADAGWLITQFITGAEPLDPARLRSDPVALAAVVAALSRLHRAAVRFERVFDPFETIEDYLQKLAGAPDPLPLDPALLAALPIAAGWVAAEAQGLPNAADPSTGASPSIVNRPLTAPSQAAITDPILCEVLATLLAERVADRARQPSPSRAEPNLSHDAHEGGFGSSPSATDEPIRPTTEPPVRPMAPSQANPDNRPTPPPPPHFVPSHGDPTPANMLFDGVAVTLIDWEYAAMAHPLWDFAGLAVEADLPVETEIAMLAMAGAKPTRAYVALKFAAFAVSGLWAALREDAADPDHAIAKMRDDRLAKATVLADRILAAR